MSQGLMAYLSWNTRAFPEHPREIAPRHEARLQALEREINSPITWKEAARQLSFDENLVPAAAPLYWAIVELTLGCFNHRVLPNTPFMPCSFEQLRNVDAELERQHVPLSLVELVLGEPRYDWIPNPESSPLVSWWNPDQIAEAYDAASRIVAPADPHLASSLATIRGWIDVVAKTKPYPGYADSRACIVGFYY
jgi:hypothetical protein